MVDVVGGDRNLWADRLVDLAAEDPVLGLVGSSTTKPNGPTKVGAGELGPAARIATVAVGLTGFAAGLVLGAGASSVTAPCLTARCPRLGPEPFRDRFLGDPELAAGTGSVALEVATHEGSADHRGGDTDVTCHCLNGERPWRATFRLGGCSHFSHITHFATNSDYLGSRAE